MISGKISQIKNKNGETSFPVTSSKAVYMQDGVTTLENKIGELDSSLVAIQNQVGEHIANHPSGGEGESGHNHANLTTLNGITSTKVAEWNNNTNLMNEHIQNHPSSGGETHTHTNKTVLDGITSAKVTEWNNKANSSHRHSASEIDGLPSGEGTSTITDLNYLYRETPKAGEGCVVFITDDGRDTDLNFREVFNRYNRKFCVAIITNLVGNTGYMNWEQIKTLQAEGHEVLSHTSTHNGVDANNENDIIDIVNALDSFKENNVKVSSLVYPYNRASDYVKRYVLKYHRSAFGYGGNGEYANSIPLNSRFYLNRLEARGNEGVDYSNYDGSRMLDAIKNGEMLVYMLHSHYSPVNKQTELVEAMVKYCVENNIDICTVDEALDRFQNVIQIGGTIDDNSYWCVAPDKTIYSSAMEKVTGVSLDKNIVNIGIGDNLKLNASVLPSTASNKNVTWSSSDENIATVNNEGLIIAISEGECQITCSSDANVLAKAVCNIIVSDDSTPPNNIILNNCIGWLDARDVLEAVSGNWCMIDRINNDLKISLGSGTTPSYHENGAILQPGNILTDKYHGSIDFSSNTFTLCANFKLSNTTTPASGVINWYDSATAGTFVRLDQGKVSLYKSWTKLCEIVIPTWTDSENSKLVIRVDGNNATVFYNTERIDEVMSGQFVNFEAFKMEIPKNGGHYLHSIYMYNSALTDNDIAKNKVYESGIQRG